ncbi:MAG: putative rane-associated zinc metalloprotease [Candidatus Eremiobacteraeota bacterium]|nr:putative rane-associated zinc metalloprotease [Candidatus Eremiobacteraeota bacterium]
MSPQSILLFLVTLSVLVVLHEYGHFIVARLNGVRVTDFALGMGPTLAKWTSKRSGTVYRLNAFPIGGYCQMKGEDGQSTEAEQQRAFRDGHEYDADNFQAKTPLQRLAIVLAGPIMNFILAFALLFAGALAFGVVGSTATTMIAEVVPGMPAAKAGLQAGDTIVAINGRAMADGNALVEFIHASAGKRLHVEYDHNGVRRTIDITPISSKNPVTGKMEGRLGFQPLPPPERVGVVKALEYSGRQFAFVTTSTLGALGALVTHPKDVAGQVRGPIGMAQASAQAQRFGAYIFVSFAALISISLGIFNLLPIPALDGGRGVFILVEMLRGRPVPAEKEALVHVGGFAVLIVLMIAVSYHDVAAMFSGKPAF